MVQDSEGKANVGTVTIGEYPILTSEIEGIERIFAECPECKLKTINVTAEEVGEGKVPAKVVAFLQTNPDIDYIEWTFSDLSTGVRPALEAAGLTDKVTTVGVNANPADLTELTKGEQAAWTMQPSKYGDWLTLDVAARLALGMPLEQYEKEGAAADLRRRHRRNGRRIDQGKRRRMARTGRLRRRVRKNLGPVGQ